MQTISIALCTYNGAKFLKEQLQSLVNQTLLPSEVIISDDGSTDATSVVVKEFNDRLNIKFYHKEYPIKVTKNFEGAIALCSGDLIFLCDQDDVWHPDKIEKIVDYFNHNPTKLAVFSDAELVDDEEVSLNINFWSSVRLNQKQIQEWRNGKSIDLLLFGNRPAGCMMAFRKELVPKIIPFPVHIPDMIHDGWITMVAAMFDSIGLIEEKLISYRQHSSQQIGVRTKEKGKVITLKDRIARQREERLSPFLEKRDYYALLEESLSERIDKSNLNFKKISNIIHFYEVRATMPNLRLKRIMPILKLLFNGDYHRYKDQDANWKSPFLAVLGDMFE